MSTWLYLECRSHEPPLIADDESGQHLTDLPRIRREIAYRGDVVKRLLSWTQPSALADWTPEMFDNYFGHQSALFLAKHMRCDIGIRDEYGQEHPVE